MRTLVLVHEAHAANGGIAKFNRDMLAALDAMPQNEGVDVFALLKRSPVEHGLRKVVYRANGSAHRGAFAAAVLWHALLRRPRLIVCGHINFAPVAWLAGRISGAPVLLTIHGVDAWTPHRQRSVRWALRQGMHVLAVSGVTKERFCAWSAVPESRVTVVPNSVDLAAFTPGEPRRTLVDRYDLAGRKVLLTLARLEPTERYKGIDEVIDVLPQVARVVPNVLYVIAGAGADQPRLLAKAQAQGLGGLVRMTGFIAEEDKVDLFRAADAFVLAGWKEGFGIVLLEALACGIPVVGSKLDGSREALLDGQLGRLVDPARSSELAEALVDALSSPKGVTSPVLEHYSFAQFVRRFGDLAGAVALGEATCPAGPGAP